MTSSTLETAALQSWVDSTWTKATAKITRASARIGATFPHVAPAGTYDRAPAHWWTAGFWPGMLWLVYRDTRDERLQAIAEACERQLDAVIWEFDNLWHDIGFMWSLTSVARYRVTGADDARRRALIAASILASRFNLRGQYIRAWNGDKAGWAIVDCLMNLPLLHWASRCTDDPRFAYVAMAHADTSIRHFVRPDGSCRHIVAFDPKTGDVIGPIAGQGYAPESAWSRGAAWALYGFALTYRYTCEPRYLATACRIADFFIGHLPGDLIPYWDFRAPVEPQTPRDSSAAACAASGLFELAELVGDARADGYRAAAVRMLQALDRQCTAWERDDDVLLRLGAGNVPEGQNVNVSLIYGDYFFLEALAKLRGEVEVFW